MREQSHNLKILPVLPLLSLCHCGGASPVAPCPHLPSLSTFFLSPTSSLLHVVLPSQFAHTLCQRCVVPARQIHSSGYLHANIKDKNKISRSRMKLYGIQYIPQKVWSVGLQFHFLCMFRMQAKISVHRLSTLRCRCDLNILRFFLVLLT